ncbi:hypothetical protein HDU99_008762, partial [Rhizoclosmatium hyalinum]
MTVPTAQPESYALVKEIMELLGEPGLDPLINKTEWPEHVPFDLYARQWISVDQTLQFMESEIFEPAYLLLAQYLPTVENNSAVLLAKTNPGNESWLHLLARGYLEVREDRKYIRVAMACVNIAEVFIAVDAQGKSVKEVWEEVRNSVERGEQAEVKRILALIENREQAYEESLLKVKEEKVDPAAAPENAPMLSVEASHVSIDSKSDDVDMDVDVGSGTDMSSNESIH